MRSESRSVRASREREVGTQDDNRQQATGTDILQAGGSILPEEGLCRCKPLRDSQAMQERLHARHQWLREEGEATRHNRCQETELPEVRVERHTASDTWVWDFCVYTGTIKLWYLEQRGELGHGIQSGTGRDCGKWREVSGWTSSIRYDDLGLALRPDCKEARDKADVVEQPRTVPRVQPGAVDVSLVRRDQVLDSLPRLPPVGPSLLPA